LFLANKTEENCRKTKDIIVAVAKVAQKNPKLIIDEQSKEYWRWRDSILMYEEVMLETLTFDLSVENPLRLLYGLLLQVGHQRNKTLRQAAWAWCNDACLTTLPLLFEPRDISIASILFASVYTREPINDINDEPWWRVLNANEERIVKAIEIAREFYTENPLRKSDSPYQGSPEFNLENTRKNGEGSSTNPTPQTDRDTQSPKARVNGTDINVGSREQELTSTAAEEASQTAPGDSDAILKEAANDPATHQNTNGNANGLLSPGGRKRDVEEVLTESREQKRQKMSSDDEGEVQE
jgi:hypothetical protein